MAARELLDRSRTTGRAVSRSVRHQVQRLLDEPSFAQCAVEVQRDMLATPTLQDVVPELERAASAAR